MRYTKPKGADEAHVIAQQFANLMERIDPHHDEYPAELFTLEYWLEHQPEKITVTYKKAEEVFKDV